LVDRYDHEIKRPEQSFFIIQVSIYTNIAFDAFEYFKWFYLFIQRIDFFHLPQDFLFFKPTRVVCIYRMIGDNVILISLFNAGLYKILKSVYSVTPGCMIMYHAFDVF